LRLKGTWARAVSLLANFTFGQQDVTAAFIVTVAVTEPGPTTLAGLNVTEETSLPAGLNTVRLLLVVTPP
jgi:hypothetical protein